MEYCSICGAPISENNVSGIGCECLAAIHAAKKYKAKKEGNLSLKLYIYEANIVREKFVQLYKDVKFRSEFKKGFFASMEKAERISKKQLDIMYKMVDEKFGSFPSIYTVVNKMVSEYEEALINDVEVNRSEIEVARTFIRNCKSGKANNIHLRKLQFA